MFWIMAKMQSAGLGSSPIEKEYWGKNGWLGKKRPWKDGKQKANDRVNF